MSDDDGQRSPDDGDQDEDEADDSADPARDEPGELEASALALGLEGALDKVEHLLKSGTTIASLTHRGINASLALLAVEALRNYLAGRKQQASTDFATLGEEIGARLAATKEPG